MVVSNFLFALKYNPTAPSLAAVNIVSVPFPFWRRISSPLIENIPVPFAIIESLVLWYISRSNPVPKNNLSLSWKLAFALWVVNPDITTFDILVVPSTLISPLTSNLLLGFATPSPTNCVPTS